MSNDSHFIGQPTLRELYGAEPCTQWLGEVVLYDEFNDSNKKAPPRPTIFDWGCLLVEGKNLVVS